MRIYDTLRSGSAWKVRLMASLVGVPLVRTTLSIDRGDLKAEAFRRVAPLGQVPILELPDGTHLAESMAILFWLARGSRWWPDDPSQQASVLTWLSFEQSAHMPALAPLRLHLALHGDWRPTDAQAREHAARAHRALDILEAQLGRQIDGHGAGRAWVATVEHASIADVALYPYTCMAPMGGIDLEPYPAIQAWLRRMEALPGYQALFAGEPERNLSTQELP